VGRAAPLVVRLIAADRAHRRRFRPPGSLADDDRLLRWFDPAVSIWTVTGRQWIPFVAEARAQACLATRTR
jgi:hypothetical protein